jgi:hypothetical protein
LFDLTKAIALTPRETMESAMFQAGQTEHRARLKSVEGTE